MLSALVMKKNHWLAKVLRPRSQSRAPLWMKIWNFVQAWWSGKMIRHLKRVQGLRGEEKSPDCRAAFVLRLILFCWQVFRKFSHLRVGCVSDLRLWHFNYQPDLSLTRWPARFDDFFARLSTTTSIKCEPEKNHDKKIIDFFLANSNPCVLSFLDNPQPYD